MKSLSKIIFSGFNIFLLLTIIGILLSIYLSEKYYLIKPKSIRNRSNDEEDGNNNLNIRNPFPKYLHQCNEDEYQLLADGFNYARDIGFLSRAAQYHGAHFRSGHNNPYAFFPFHGEFIKQMNDVLKEYDSRLSLPIWDLRTQPRYPTFFYDLTRDWSEIVRLRPRNTNIRRQAFDNVQNIPYGLEYIDFINYCSWIHNVIHDDYGGTFGSPISPLDPLFWSFHAFWDDVYERYLQIRNINIRHTNPMPVPLFSQ